jgi:hypothetical protein
MSIIEFLVRLQIKKKVLLAKRFTAVVEERFSAAVHHELRPMEPYMPSPLQFRIRN